VTPSFNGFQGGVLVAEPGRTGDNKAGRIYNIGGKYSDGPLLAGLTYYHEDDGSSASASSGATYQLTTAGAKYAFQSFALRAGISFASISGPGQFQSIASMSARKAQAAEVGVDYSFSDSVTGSADVLYRRDSTQDNHTTGLRALGVYKLTPQASLLVNVAYLKNGGGASETLVNTDSTAVGGGFPNQSQTSIALGGRYSF
jgi:predicted porin